MKFPLIFIFFLSMLTGNSYGQKNNNNKLENENSEASECIKNVIHRDSELGEIRNHACEQSSLSETISGYTTSLKSLDYSNCPEKFKLSFNDHINAWLGVKKVSDKYPQLRGELHVLFNELENSKDSIEFKMLSKRIWDTWKIVENSAKE